MRDFDMEGEIEPNEAATTDFVHGAMDQLEAGEHNHVLLAWHTGSQLTFRSYCIESLDQLDWFERQWRTLYNRVRDRLMERDAEDGDGDEWKENG